MWFDHNVGLGKQSHFISFIIETYTVELQWLEHLSDHANMFETGVVGLNNIYSQKNAYVNTTQMVQDLTVSATLIYKSSPETNQKLQYM